jgi:hypothetical protein
VGRDPNKLRTVQAEIDGQPGGHAVSIVCDFSDIVSARRAAAEIIALDLSLAGVLNNAGVMPTHAERTPPGRNLAFATNHLGPFAFTEALMPHLPDGANVVFICSGVEDPERKPAVTWVAPDRLHQLASFGHDGVDRSVDVIDPDVDQQPWRGGWSIGDPMTADLVRRIVERERRAVAMHLPAEHALIERSRRSWM